MSLMDMCEVKPQRKITKNWLKTHLFEQCRWGSPAARESDGSVFYEMLIYGRDVEIPDITCLTYLGQVMYFPETFTGYTYFGSSMYGHGIVANKVVINLIHRWFPNDKDLEIFAAVNTTDMNEVLNALRIILSAEGYELVLDKKLIKLHENESA